MKSFAPSKRLTLGALMALFSLVAVPPPVSAHPFGLSGRYVVLDPGHGGRDSGTRQGGMIESEINVDVARMLSKELKQAGVVVLLTRRHDASLLPEDLHYEKRPRAEMDARIRVAKAVLPDVYLSIHCNAWVGGGSAQGAQVFVDPEASEASLGLGKAISDVVVRHTGTKRLLSRKINHYILKSIPAPVTTVEMGFLTDPTDRAHLQNPQYRQKFSRILMMGLVTYFTELPLPANES